MTGSEVVAIILGIVDAAMRLASCFTAALDPEEAETVRTRLAAGMSERANLIAADEAAEWGAVPK